MGQDRVLLGIGLQKLLERIISGVQEPHNERDYRQNAQDSCVSTTLSGACSTWLVRRQEEWAVDEEFGRRGRRVDCVVLSPERS
jgi:hypothetical protein